MTVPRLLTGALLVALLTCAALAQPAKLPAAIQAPPELGPTPMGMSFIEGGELDQGADERDLDRFFRRLPPAFREYTAVEMPEHEVEVERFFLDRFEVTNAQYLAFLEDHKTVFEVKENLDTLSAIAVELYGRANEPWWRALYWQNVSVVNKDGQDVEDDGQPKTDWAQKKLPVGTKLKIYTLTMPHHWLDRKGKIDGLESHPVVFVSWVNAQLYAAWAGKHLPSESEWEWAARGEDGRIRAWGGTFRKDDWNGDKEDRLNCFDLRANNPRHPAFHSDPSILTTPVGSFPEGASPFGILDMLGNVWEWTASPMGPYPGAKGDPQDWWKLVKVVRGGSYSTPGAFLRTTVRYAGDGMDVLMRRRTSSGRSGSAARGGR
jgi:formylglycine-generating enzyme required for sulfatase activity